jgi:tetratricopeptide (TPR) repeat protein
VRVYGKLGTPERSRPHLEAQLLAAAIGSPEAAQAREQLADLHFSAGNLDEARPLYSQLIEAATQARRRGKEVARLHTRLGEIAEKKGDLAAALASYGEAQKLDASHAPTLVALARLQMQKQDWESARKLYRSLLLQNLDAAAGITKTGVYIALGEIHEKLNEGPKAIGMYERALELDAGNEAIRAALARLRGG